MRFFHEHVHQELLDLVWIQEIFNRVAEYLDHERRSTVSHFYFRECVIFNFPGKPRRDLALPVFCFYLFLERFYGIAA